MVNEQMRQNWADGAAGWVANEAIVDAVFAPVTAALLDVAGIAAGQRVLDVGCGTGTLLAAAAAVGAEPVGVDISPGMVGAAQRRVPQATVVVGDAQVVDVIDEAPGAPFDRVVSRFGVMFFAEPQEAFGNIGQASGPGARMAFVCWRAREENPLFTLGTDVLTAGMDPVPAPPEPDAPGPNAFADEDRLRSLLSASGWTAISVDAFDFECDYAVDGSDGVEERLAVILASSSGRQARAQLEPTLGPDGWAQLLDEVRAELRRHFVRGAVRFPGATWLVTARNGTR